MTSAIFRVCPFKCVNIFLNYKKNVLLCKKKEEQMLEKKVLDGAVDLLMSGKPDLSKMFKEGGLIKQLVKCLLERALKAEMDEHLGYERYDRSNSENSRNGSNSKTLITENGGLEIEVPRDRNGDFEPQLIKKRQTRIAELDEKILTFYAKGMSISDIRLQLQELYATDVSESLISRVTDEILDEVTAWRSRPLEKIYPLVFFDCLFVKVRQDKRIINKSVYVSLGVNFSGNKEILGLWISENEGAKFWLSNLNELKNRGVQDILIACSDNLTGMSEAIRAAFPKTTHQLCIVHQLRNSFKYVSYKDRKLVAADLNPIYTAVTEQNALVALECFEKKWNTKYPQISKSWRANWANLIGFLDYPDVIRKIIYTTNMLESFNSQLRRVTNNKRIFPNDESVFKTLYLTIRYIERKWTQPISNWKEAMANFSIKFEERI
jgi:transposase-like protein